MKKVISILILLFTFTGGYALATSVNSQFEGNPIIKLFSGGQELVVSDVPAINYKNRTMVPIYLLNQLGITTKWDPKTYSVDIKLPEPATVVKTVHELTQAQLDEIAKSVSLTYAVDDALYATKQGSGFLLNNGVFITNEHIGGVSKAIQYYLNGKTLNNHGETLFRNTTSDLYAVQTSETGGLKYSTKLPDIGDKVWAIGYPHEKLTITTGVVTGFETYNSITYIKDSAQTEPGHSGGVLLDGNGDVIGITSAITEKTREDLAIPMKYVEEELNKLK